MKMIVFHNTIAEYNLVWFRELSLRADTTFVIDNFDMSRQIYGYEYHSGDINAIPYPDDIKDLEPLCKDADFILIQEPDCLHEYKRCLQNMRIATKYHIKRGIFWEIWYNKKAPCPLKKRIFNAIQNFLVRPVLWRCNVCLAPGEKTAEWYKSRGIRKSKIAKIGIPCTPPETDKSPSDVRAENGIGEGDYMFLFLARMVYWKGADLLISAFDEFKKSRADAGRFKLMIAGDGEFLEECKTLGEKVDGVCFVGRVEPDVRKAYFDACDCFVLPSRSVRGSNESWGRVINEAMTCGKPVIASDACGAAFDLVTDETGLMFRQGNISSLTEKLASAANTRYDPKTIKQYIENFSEKAMVNKLISAMENH